MSDTEKTSEQSDEDGENTDSLIDIQYIDFQQSIFDCYWELKNEIDTNLSIAQTIDIISFDKFINLLPKKSFELPKETSK